MTKYEAVRCACCGGMAELSVTRRKVEVRSGKEYPTRDRCDRCRMECPPQTRCWVPS